MNVLKNAIVMLQLIILANISPIYARESSVLTSPDNLDRYSWMEACQSCTAKWLGQRTKQSRKTIDALPWRETTQQQLNALNHAEGTLSNLVDAGGDRFYLRSTPAFPYLRLFVKRKNGSEQLLIDPPVGTGIQFFSPSYDGRYIAYGLAENGSEFASINILDTRKGKSLPDVIPRVRYPLIAWRGDNQSFFYRRMPSVNQKALPAELLAGQKVYLHHTGNDVSLDMVVFDSFMVSEKAASVYDDVAVYASPDSEWLVSSISTSTSGYSSTIFKVRAEALNGAKTPWEKIIDSSENISHFILSGKWLYLAKYNDSSGYHVARKNLEDPKHAEETIVEWSRGELTGFITNKDSLYITYHDNGTRKFLRAPFENISSIQNISLPFQGEITALFSDYGKKEILFTLQGWTKPPVILRYDPDKNIVEDTGLIAPQSHDFSDYEVEEIWVISKNNVRVPLTIIHKRGLNLDGTAPVWLTTYGAYGVSTFPNFDASRLIWLRKGGVIAIAHVRGGGELGPFWHEEGRASNKGNSISDFIDCAEYLIENGYTHPSKLVISGESAGGIIIGMALVKRPDMFAAAAIHAGMLNTIRLDQIPIGAMNFKELGSPFTKEGMRDLKKIDAYYNLKDGVRYPAVMLTVGMNDARVSPWQTAKFAARLEEITATVEKPNPVLVVSENEAGHSPATYEQADRNFLDILNFFIWRTTLTKK